MKDLQYVLTHFMVSSICNMGSYLLKRMFSCHMKVLWVLYKIKPCINGEIESYYHTNINVIIITICTNYTIAFNYLHLTLKSLIRPVTLQSPLFLTHSIFRSFYVPAHLKCNIISISAVPNN